MALEVFATLDDDGCNNGKSFIFCGSKSDLMGLAKPLAEVYEANRRKVKIKTLADKFIVAAAMPHPQVRIEKAEGQVLMDTLDKAAEGHKESHKYRKLYAFLVNRMPVYGP